VSDFTIRGLDHVTVTTPEELETEVLEFYESTLGLRRLDKPAGTRSSGGWFAVGDLELRVSLDSHNPPPKAHFAVTVDDFDVVVGRMRASGFHIEQARPIPGRHRFFTRDPAGNRIEIVSYDR
jgi:catechol 2,3-dioxygenase-like lactoylglutathione lyase family enzyme